MLRIIGAIMLIMGTGTVGLVIARNFSLRPQQIRHLKSALQMLETEVLFGLTPLPLGLQRVGKKMASPINKLFLITGKHLSKGEGLTAGEAWEIALKELEQESALLLEDLDILLYFGQSLGGSDREEQHKNFKLVQEHLKNAESKAEELKIRNTKMWQYLGFSFGGVIALILL